MGRRAIGRGGRGINAIVAVGLTTGLALGLGMGTAGASTKSQLAHAKTQLLTLKDMPKGWSASASTGGGSTNFPKSALLTTCIGVPASSLVLSPPSVSSKEFANSNQTQIVNEDIAAYASAKVAKRQLAVLSNPKAADCFAQILNGPDKSQFQSAFGAQASLGTVTGSRASAANYAPHATALTLSFTVKYQGVTVPVKITSVYFVKGSEGVEIGFNAVNATFSKSLSKHLSALALGRL